MSTGNLIPCPDCGHPVSRNAPTCLKCGSPLQARTIEQTGKAQKAAQLVGWGICGIGLIVGYAGIQVPVDSSGDTPVLTLLGLVAAFLLVFTGIATILAAKFSAWWYHG